MGLQFVYLQQINHLDPGTGNAISVVETRNENTASDLGSNKKKIQKEYELVV